MLCQNCNENEANIKYTQIINGEKIEMYLCEECSKKLGINNIDLNLPINFSSFFGDFLNEYNEAFMPLLKKTNELKCNKCGMTYNEFMQKGKFGCDNCYEVFSEKIDPILKRLQGSNRYNGKVAENNNYNEKIIEDKKIQNEELHTHKEEIDELKEKLKKLVQEEEYEEAAKVRDKIKELEGKNK